MIADLVGRIRSLRQQPLLSAATIVTLGVGSAVCCVGVSLLDSILCNPLPYPEPDRLVVAWSVKLDEPDRVRPVSRRVFDEWKSTNRSFAQLAAIRDWPFLMAGSSGPEQYRGALVSEEFLPILGAYMSAGRYFTPEDFGGSGADSAILSHRIWQERFGADAAVIGRSVTLDSRSVTVVGVLGESFAFLPRPNSDIWPPRTSDPDQAAFPDRGNLWAVGRMRDGVTLREAQSELQLVSERLSQSAPDANRGLGARVVSLHQQVVGVSRASLLGVWAGTTIVFLIACCNVLALLVSRWISQRRELAIRAAVGAVPSQLARLIGYDILWIMRLGAGGGLLLSTALLKSIVALNPTVFPRLEEVAVNWAGAAFTIALGILGIVAIAPPSIVGTARFHIIAESLKADHSATRSRSTQWRAQDTLISLETALAFALVTATVLMIQTVLRLESFDLGFNSRGILTARLPFSVADYPSAETLNSRYRTLLNRIASVHSVTSVGASTSLPVSGIRESQTVSIEAGETGSASVAQVSPGYFWDALAVIFAGDRSRPTIGRRWSS